MNIEEGLQKFLVQLEADGRSLHTIRQYQRHIRLFAHWAHDVGHCRDVSAITHEDVARFLSSTHAKTRPDGGIKRSTSMNALRSSVKGFFSYMHQAGYTTQNPTRLTRRAICGTPPPRALSQDEQDRLLNTLARAEGPEARRDHVLFRVMLGTGIRLGSAVALDVQDIDLERGELWIQDAKGNRPERVFLGKSLQKHLRIYIVENATGPLFPSRTGKRLSHRHVQRRFTLWIQKAGITRPASVHSLRHTFATKLYHRTRDIFLVKEALKHRSIVSTLVYAQADESRLKQAVAVL